MHEVAIAQDIVEAALKEAKKNKCSIVKKVKVLIGEFTSVVKEALEFAIEIVKKNTAAENAEFEFEVIALKTYCEKCDRNFSEIKDINFFCELCGNPLTLISGNELQIEYIDIE